MSSLNLTMLTQTVIDRATTASAGGQLRSALGAGAQSILDAEELRAEDLPSMPVIALRRGPMPTTGRIVRLPLYTWFVYDDPVMGHYQVDQIVTLLLRLYDPASGAALLRMASQGLIADLTTDVGPHYIDPLLGLSASWVRLAITAAA